MSDPDEVLKKADALLERYGRGARTEAEEEFPVLTEVVDEPPAAQRSEPAQASNESPDPQERQREIEARILQQVQQAVSEQLGDMLGEPLRERLEACLNSALETAAAQIRNDVESMVQAAVAQAIERLRDELL